MANFGFIPLLPLRLTLGKEKGKGDKQRKTPTKLISGSGREYYYSKGIIATVVEVGTRNIPDYMQNMSESINENIPDSSMLLVKRELQ